MFKKKAISAVLAAVMLLVMVSALGGVGLAAPDDIVYTHSALGFTVTLPASWDGLYIAEEDATSVEFFSVSNADAGYGGFLFRIEVSDEEMDYPNPFSELLQADGKFYYASFPGDIPYDYTNAERAKEYNDMNASVDGILKSFRLTAGLPFNDVPASAWYYSDVKAAYESGLINGTSATTFAPDNYLTYAEAIKLAACMHQLYETGEVTLTGGVSQWYQGYVDYAKENGIISKDYDWGAQATRAGYMEIFAGALPDEALAEINTVDDGAIPDVPEAHASADAIYKLYRAGIVQGVDAARSCNPSANIKRGEVAAILTRMMDEDARIAFEM